MAAGRPTKYHPDMCQELIEAGKEGKTGAEMAVHLGIDRETLNAWIQRHSEFSSAYKKAMEYAQDWWTQKGREATFGGIEGFNATSYIFQMKNRFRDDWSDRKALDITQQHTLEIKRTIDPALLDDDERMLLRHMLTKALPGPVEDGDFEDITPE